MAAKSNYTLDAINNKDIDKLLDMFFNATGRKLSKKEMKITKRTLNKNSHKRREIFTPINP